MQKTSHRPCHYQYLAAAAWPNDHICRFLFVLENKTIFFLQLQSQSHYNELHYNEALSDTPDLFLRHTDQTFAICKAVNSPSCKFLFDMYHMQRNEGNIIANIDMVWDELGYLQIGDNPGRNEPYSGEMYYHNIFKHVHSKGYTGILGMEHGMSGKGKEGEMTLIKAYRDSDNF